MTKRQTLQYGMKKREIRAKIPNCLLTKYKGNY
jgi:hypothetical protein